MSSIAIASYLPDSQLLRLGVELPAFCDPENPRGIKTALELAVVFHEWIHYLHNVSTIHGLSAFANFVHLWSNFRRTITEDGLSGGSISLSDEERLHFRQKIAFTATARRRRSNRNPGDIKPGSVTVISVESHEVSLPNSEIQTNVLKLRLRIENAQQETRDATAEIGSDELVESVAYMLERHLILRAGCQPNPVEFLPYLLLEALAGHVAPHLRDFDVICCGIASLQDSNPPSSILDILSFAEAARAKGSSVYQTLWARQTAELTKAQDWVNQQLSIVDDMFPVDEPMARAIRETVQTIRDNFEYRRRVPFFEFGIVQALLRSGGNLSEAIEAHGACGVFQRCPGVDDEIGRDKIYEFKLGEEDRSVLSKGRRLMHAAFHFIRLHPMNGEIRATAHIPVTASNKCPFYTACTLKDRVKTPEVCRTQPWMTAHQPQANLCWYGEAVRLVSPPEVAAGLSKRFG